MNKTSKDSFELRQKECINWIESINKRTYEFNSFEELIKDGSVYRELVNNLFTENPIENPKMNVGFFILENITLCINKVRKQQIIREEELFTATDMYHSNNVNTVLTSLLALKRSVESKQSLK